MTWRDRSVQSPANDDGLTLEMVLDHYGVDYTNRSRQMIGCPFHDDAHPSFSLDLDKQLWKCHSCGEGGSKWQLIMHKEGVDFAGALRFAATLGFAGEDAGTSNKPVSRRAGRQSRNNPLSASKGNRGTRSGYVPSWRRS